MAANTQQIWVAHYTNADGDGCDDAFIASSYWEARATYEARYRNEFCDEEVELPNYDLFPIYAGMIQDGNGQTYSYTLQNETVCRYHADSPGWDACSDDHEGPCKFNPPPSDEVSKYLPDDNNEAPLTGSPTITKGHTTLRVCDECDGLGHYSDDGNEECDVCKGVGSVPYRQRS